MISLEIRNTSKISISQSLLKKSIGIWLRKLKIKKANIDILLVSNSQIRKMNAKHLNHNYETDVISFSYSESLQKAKASGLEGDLIVSLEMAKQQARFNGHPFINEVLLYVCHGILHLLGYDDHDPNKKKEMFKKQTQLLNDAGYICPIND